MVDRGSNADGSMEVLGLSAGASHTVALLSGGVVASWGRAEDGQLGHGDAEEQTLPVIIGTLKDAEITAINCGADHTTAWTENKKMVYSWGWGDFGRLGHGNSSDLFVPHPIKALYGLRIRQIACGDCHCLAIVNDGEVRSWGRNQNGQLGLGHTEDRLVPQIVEAFQGKKVLMVAAGAEHTAAVTEDGKVYGWGWGRYGNLGLGDRNDRLVPEQATSIGHEQATMVACGWRHTIVVAKSGAMYTFGWSKYGQLGHGNEEDQLVPHRVEALQEHTIRQIAGGWRHTVALDSDGRLYAWGWNKFGQVGAGDNVDHNLPALVKGMEQERVVSVACGWRHTACITEAGNVYSWGRGTSGQLGHGDNVDRSVPKRLEALSKDGLAARGLAASKVNADAALATPAERYAIVPERPPVAFNHGRDTPGCQGDCAADVPVPTNAKRPKIH